MSIYVVVTRSDFQSGPLLYEIEDIAVANKFIAVVNKQDYYYATSSRGLGNPSSGR